MIVTLGRHEAMNKDLDSLQKVYEDLGVRVDRYDSKTTDSVFHRDVAAWSPFGHVAGQLMGKESRRWEKDVWFSDCELDCRFTTPDGTFEGADLMWINSRHCVIAVGQRSNEAGVTHLRQWLEFMDIVVTIVHLPDWHEQHLLGLCNVVRGWTVFIDDRACPEVPESGWLRDAILVPHDEYRHKHTNFVQVDGSVVICDQAKKTIALLEAHCDVHPVSIDSLLAHGGGVACATGIRQEQLPPATDEWFDEWT